ncbi:MAG: radical SAM protein [Alphaproteobacteria bacterium]|nr:radical SAM protein [Alphaproteobacteria bacterium]
MDRAWIRLSRTCDNACLFCNEADLLDGTVVPLEEVQAAIDAAADGGATAVVLSGGEPTRSKHFLAAIRHAKARGLYVAVTSHGRIVQSDKIAQMLEKAGLDEYRVSVHSGRRTTHDALTQRDGSWVESLAGLRFLGKTSIRTVLVSVLAEPNQAELAHLMHIGTMAGIKEMEIRRTQPVGAARQHADVLTLGLRNALRTLATLWYEAKEEVILLRGAGFGDTVDLGYPPYGEVRQADPALLAFLRDRVFIAQAGQGTSLQGDEGMTKDVVALCTAEGGLGQVGHELAAHGAPLVDAPWCVGGRPDRTPTDVHGADAHFAEACAPCPVRSSCPGLPRKLGKLDVGVLGPLASWSGVSQGTAVVCGGDDPILTGLTLPALAEALAARGLDVTVGEPADADLIVCGDAATARRVPADRRGRLVVLDTAGGAGLQGVGADVVASSTPGLVGGLLASGVDLRTVAWRPFPVPPGCADAAPAPGGPIVAVGVHADHALLEQAVVASTGKLPPVHVYAASGQAPPSSGVLRVHLDAPDDEILAAVLAARLVVLPARRHPDTEAGRRAAAADLRWLWIAQAAGRPVVAVRAPGVEDAVRHEATGWLAPAEGPQALSEGLRRVHGTGIAERYGVQARAWAGRGLPVAWAAELVEGVLPTQPRRSVVPSRPWPAIG